MNKTLYQRLDSFDGGMNSGVDPLKVKINQSVYCTNGTFRGDFFKTRPNFRNIPLTFISTPNPTLQVPSLAVTSANATTATITATTSGAHGLSPSDTVTITGAVLSIYNVSNASIAVTSYNTFTYTVSNSVTVYVPTAITNASAAGITTATATTGSSNGLALSDYVLVSGVVPELYNGTYLVTAVSTSPTFTFSFVIGTNASYQAPKPATTFGSFVKIFSTPAASISGITAVRTTQSTYYSASACQSNFQTATALFQNAAYYVSDSGVGSVMVAIAGQLFQITPSSTSTATVQQIWVPAMSSGNNNTSNNTQAWMWQSEKWMIWNDNSSDPVFFDGQSCRRSLKGSTALATVAAAGFTAPSQGQQIAIPITAPYTYPTGIPVLIGTGTYSVVTPLSSSTAAGYSTVVLQMLNQVGDSIAAGTSQFVDSNYYAGAITKAVDANGSSITNFPAPPVNNTVQTITITGTVNYYPAQTAYEARSNNCNNLVNTRPQVGVGDIISIGGNQCKVLGVSLSSITCTPTNDYSGSISGAVNLVSVASTHYYTSYSSAGTVCSDGALPFTCGSSSIYYCPVPTVTSSTGLISNPAFSSGSWGYSGVNNSSNSYTLTLSRKTKAATNNVFNINGYVINASSTDGQNWTCTTTTAASTTTIPIITNGYPTLSQIVINTSASSTVGNSYFTYPSVNSLGTANLGITIPSTSPPQCSVSAIIAAGLTVYQGQIFRFTTANNKEAVAIVVSVSSPSSSNTSYYLQVTNLTETAGYFISGGTGIRSVPELPVGNVGAYGMGRNWVALPDGRSFVAGDIVGGSSGTGDSFGFKNRDAVLRVSENSYLAGGGNFTVPANLGSIKAMQFTAQLDASLGQGPLQVLTQNSVFSCNAPVDRSKWQSLQNPILAQSLIGSGGISQNAVSQVSGDILFRCSDGSIRSLLLARLDFNRWGNTPVSREMDRLISQENVSLMSYSSSVNFDNRFLLTAKPTQSARGVYHPSLIALNFDPNSTMSEKKPAIYDGEWTGLNILQILTGIFNGAQRCFCMCLSSDLSSIEMHEVLLYGQALQDDGVNVVSSFETGELHFGDREEDGPHLYKRLSEGEIFVDRIFSDVKVDVYYQPDQWQTWTLWSSFTIPYAQYYYAGMATGFNPRVGLNQPDGTVCDVANNRPLREGYVFQVKIQITGNARITGGRFSADVIPQPQFAKQICAAVATPVAVSIASPSIYAGVTQNPNTLIYPQSASSQSLYYSDSATVSLWYWSVFQKWVALKAPSNPVALPATYGTAVLFTQGNQQVMIGKYATPPATVTYTQAASSTNPFPVTSTALFAPPIPTQPCLYYQDQPVTGTAPVNLYQWSPINKTWMAILVGSSSDVVMPALVASYSQPITISAAATPSPIQPANAAAVYVQDAAIPKMWLWSINKGAWFLAI